MLPMKVPSRCTNVICMLVVCVLGGTLNGQVAQTQANAPRAGEIAGVGNFIHIVFNLDKSVEFYRDFLGLDFQRQPNLYAPVRDFIADMYDARGAQDRSAILTIPGFDMNIELIEFKAISKRARLPQLQYPGATILTLTVRDLDSVLERMRKGGTTIVTRGGAPIKVRDGEATERVVYVQDPDGFFVALVEVPSAVASVSRTPGNAIDMKFGLVVADASAAMTFYQETLGLEPLPSVGFMPDKIQMDVAGSPGLYQKLVGTFPKTGFQIEFLEFRGVTSKPIHPGVHDAGAPILRLRSRDIDLLSQHLKTAGFSMVSLSGAVSDQGNTRLIMARDPNNLFIQFVQPTRGAAR